MEFSGQTHAVDHDHGFYGNQMNSRQGQCDVNPEPDVMTQPQPPLLHEQGDFPRRDRRNRNPVCLGCLFYEVPRRLPESLVIGNCPDQNMGVEDDHRLAAQSDGSAAGSKGSSYSSTEPGIAPMIGMVPLAGGSGDNIATGRPRFVIVTGSRSLPICPITRRHLALKSVTAIFFNVSPASTMYRTREQHLTLHPGRRYAD